MRKISIKDLDKYIHRSLTGCWLWTKTSPDKNGYCHVGRHNLAHRWVYENLVGPIPNGKLLHHRKEICSSKRCVNPDHVELTTPSDHIDAGPNINRSKTHCVRGHEYTKENTIIDKSGWRKCLACRNNRNRTHDSEVAALKYKHGFI
jgi:hypothetical protein